MIYFVHRLTPDVLSITSKYSISFSCASFLAPTPKRKLDATYINYHATAIKLCEHLRSLHSSLKAVSYGREDSDQSMGMQSHSTFMILWLP